LGQALESFLVGKAAPKNFRLVSLSILKNQMKKASSGKKRTEAQGFMPARLCAGCVTFWPPNNSGQGIKHIETRLKCFKNLLNSVARINENFVK